MVLQLFQVKLKFEWFYLSFSHHYSPDKNKTIGGSARTLLVSKILHKQKSSLSVPESKKNESAIPISDDNNNNNSNNNNNNTKSDQHLPEVKAKIRPLTSSTESLTPPMPKEHQGGSNSPTPLSQDSLSVTPVVSEAAGSVPSSFPSYTCVSSVDSNTEIIISSSIEKEPERDSYNERPRLYSSAQYGDASSSRDSKLLRPDGFQRNKSVLTFKKYGVYIFS